MEGLRIHDLRHTAVALWIAAGANPKEVSAHLYPEADTALRDRLDALYGSAQPVPTSQLPRPSGRGPSVAPGGSGKDKNAADGTPRTL